MITNKPSKGKAGVSLGIVLIFVLVMTVLGTAMLMIVSVSTRQAVFSHRLDGHYYSAEAALNRAIVGILSDLSGSPSRMTVAAGIQNTAISVAGTTVWPTNVEATYVQSTIRNNPILITTVENSIRDYIISSIGNIPTRLPRSSAPTNVNQLGASPYLRLINGNNVNEPADGFGMPAFVNFERQGASTNVDVGFDVNVSGANGGPFNIHISPYITLVSESGTVILTESIRMQTSSFTLSATIEDGDGDFIGRAFAVNRGNEKFGHDADGNPREVNLYRGSNMESFDRLHAAANAAHAAVNAITWTTTIGPNRVEFNPEPDNRPSDSWISETAWNGMSREQRVAEQIRTHPNRASITHLNVRPINYLGLLDLSEYYNLEFANMQSQLFIRGTNTIGVIGPDPYNVNRDASRQGIPLVMRTGGHLTINQNGTAESIIMNNVEMVANGTIAIYLPERDGGNANFGNAAFYGTGDISVNAVPRTSSSPLNRQDRIFPLGGLHSAPQFITNTGSFSLQPGGVYYGLYLSANFYAQFVNNSATENFPYIFNGILMSNQTSTPSPNIGFCCPNAIPNPNDTPCPNPHVAPHPLAGQCRTPLPTWFQDWPTTTGTSNPVRANDEMITDGPLLNRSSVLNSRFINDFGTDLFSTSAGGGGGGSGITTWTVTTPGGATDFENFGVVRR